MPFVQVQVAQLHARQFRCTAAAGIQHFEQGAISSPAWLSGDGPFQHPLDDARRQHLGHALPQLLAAEQLGQVVGQHPFELQIAEEKLERNQMPRQRCRGQLPIVQPAGVFGKLLDREAGNHPLAQPVVEAAEVAAIGHDRIGRQMALALQVADKGLDPRMVDGQRSLGGGSQHLSFRRCHAV